MAKQEDEAKKRAKRERCLGIRDEIMERMDAIYINKKTKERKHSETEAEGFAPTAYDGTDDEADVAASRSPFDKKRKSRADAGSSPATSGHAEDQVHDSQ